MRTLLGIVWPLMVIVGSFVLFFGGGVRPALPYFIVGAALAYLGGRR